jgi:type IV pilus assembly protein PilB
MGIQPDKAKPVMISRGHGCPKCSGRGMKGRTAAYEVLPMSDPIREMVLRQGSGVDLADLAVSEGMCTMRQSGVRKVLDGVTTPEEVLRVLYVED